MDLPSLHEEPPQPPVLEKHSLVRGMEINSGLGILQSKASHRRSCRRSVTLNGVRDEDQRRVEDPARLESNAPPRQFYFVPSNTLQQAQEGNGKPDSQRYLTTARKHVMRGEWSFTEIMKTYANKHV